MIPAPDRPRRAFVKSGALALVALGAAPRFLVRAAHASAGRRRVLIAVFQRGAVDGLSMIVPHGDPGYSESRRGIAIAPPARSARGRSQTDADGAVELDGFFALHPAMAPLAAAWSARRLAVVHACGSPLASRSHFDAQDFMESGTPGIRTTPDGWLGRALGARRAGAGTAFSAVAIGSVLPRTLRGSTPALALPNVGEFDVRDAGGMGGGEARQAFEALYARGPRADLREAGRDSFEAMRLLRAARLERLSPEHGAEYPRSRFGESLRQIAQLIKADVGLEAAFADSGGWDTHAAQGNERGALADRLADLARGLAALERDLGDRMADVVVLTMSEFGRTVRENGNRGTDHGHGTAMLVLGGPVRGGAVRGRWPGLAREQLFEGRDLAVTTDFRHLFAEIAVRHLGVAQTAPLFPGTTIDAAQYPGVLA